MEAPEGTGRPGAACMERDVLDILAQAVEQNRANIELAEEELASVPRWRFRRRAALERRLERRLSRQAELREVLEDQRA